MKEQESILGLATIRQNRGVSLQDISASTKISVRCLQAIEGGDFRKLPGGIYNTSYIRQYARAIDYDECELLAFYHRVMSGEAVKPEAKGKPIINNFRPASGMIGG